MEDTEYQSMKADLQNTREETEKAQAQEDACAMQASKSKTRMIRLKDAKAACMELICQIDEWTTDVKMPSWWPLVMEEGWNDNDTLAIDFDATSDISDTGDPKRLHRDDLVQMKDNLTHQIQLAAKKPHRSDDSHEGNQSLSGLHEKLQERMPEGTSSASRKLTTWTPQRISKRAKCRYRLSLDIHDDEAEPMRLGEYSHHTSFGYGWKFERQVISLTMPPVEERVQASLLEERAVD